LNAYRRARSPVQSTPGKRNSYLLLTVFVAGMTALGVELSASRLLDPFFGNSIIIWANLIGLVLIYLSLGYWLGGRWADQDPRASTLYQITAWAAFTVGLIPFVSAPILRWSVLGFANFNAGILIGSLLGVLVLFSVPMTLLGCVSPFAIRLAVKDVEHSGNVAGGIYALSTLGSILGTFLPVLLLIPNIGTRRTFLFFSLLLLLISLGGLMRQSWRRGLAYVWMVIVIVALSLFWSAGPIRADQNTVYETESQYNYIQVVKEGGDYWLYLNEGQGIHSVYNPDYILIYGIWDYFLMAPYFNNPPYTADRVDSLLLIGSAAGTIPRQYTAVYGDIPIDGVEIDPGIIQVGRQWFDMNQPNLNAVAADGRYYLANVNKRYEVIGIDAYRPPYIPFHLTTVEFFTQARDHLTDEGVVVVNVARTANDYSLVNALVSTMKAVYPSVYVLDAPDYGSDLGNSLVVGTIQPTHPENLAINAALMEDPLLQDVAARSLNTRLWEVRCTSNQTWLSASPLTSTIPVETCMPPFTDDQAPVEQVVHALILRYVLGQ
jgi:predicted membrane-bound spermidine synthase